LDKYNLSDLLHCPFCGGSAALKVMPLEPGLIATTGKSMSYRPFCSECDCSISNAWYSAKDAIAAWNHRADQPNAPHDPPESLEDAPRG
jgi:hypothetical protein